MGWTMAPWHCSKCGAKGCSELESSAPGHLWKAKTIRVLCWNECIINYHSYIMAIMYICTIYLYVYNVYITYIYIYAHTYTHTCIYKYIYIYVWNRNQRSLKYDIKHDWRVMTWHLDLELWVYHNQSFNPSILPNVNVIHLSTVSRLHIAHHRTRCSTVLRNHSCARPYNMQ